MKTGYQIEQINQFSITSVFWRLLDGVRAGISACRHEPGQLQAAWGIGAVWGMHAVRPAWPWHHLPWHASIAVPTRMRKPPSSGPPTHLQAFNLLGNAGIGTTGAGTVSSSSEPVVTAKAGTDAELAAGQQSKQPQVQPATTGAR